MSKLIMWLSVFIGVLFVMRLIAHHKARAQQMQQQAKAQARQTAQGASREAEQMVSCDRCGLHLPQSEAIKTIGGIWCSEKHARLGANR